jgi:hypothetical protein
MLANRYLLPSVRATLQPSYCHRNIAPGVRHLLPVALLGVLGARQGYGLRNRTMLSDEVPSGAGNIMVGRHERLRRMVIGLQITLL